MPATPEMQNPPQYPGVDDGHLDACNEAQQLSDLPRLPVCLAQRARHASTSTSQIRSCAHGRGVSAAPTAGLLVRNARPPRRTTGAVPAYTRRISTQQQRVQQKPRSSLPARSASSPGPWDVRALPPARGRKGVSEGSSVPVRTSSTCEDLLRRSTEQRVAVVDTTTRSAPRGLVHEVGHVDHGAATPRSFDYLLGDDASRARRATNEDSLTPAHEDHCASAPLRWSRAGRRRSRARSRLA